MDAGRPPGGVEVVICIAERLGAQWAGEFDGLAVLRAASGAALAGRLPDQAALIGVLARLHQLNLTIVAVRVADQTELLNPLPIIRRPRFTQRR